MEPATEAIDLKPYFKDRLVCAVVKKAKFEKFGAAGSILKNFFFLIKFL